MTKPLECENPIAARSETIVDADNEAGRKQVQIALQESERQFATLADTIPHLAWMAHADGFIFWYNHRWYEYTGKTPAEMEGWGWQSVHDQNELPAVMERWQRSLQTAEPFEMEFPLLRGDGVFRWFLTRVTPILDTEGKVVRWFGTNTDVTEIRLARENLRESEAKIRALNESLEERVRLRTVALATANDELGQARAKLQNVLDAATHVSIIATDMEGVIAIFNSGAEHMLGYTSEEMVGKTSGIFHLESEVIARGLELTKETGKQIHGFDVFEERVRDGQPEEREWTYVRKDGQHLSVNLVVTSLRDAGGASIGFLSVAMDVSARKKAEAALLAKDEHFRLIVETVDNYALIMLDINGNVISWNIGAERIKGYKADEIVGRHFSLFYLPEDIERRHPDELLAFATKHGSYKEENWRVRKDGSRFLAYVSIAAIHNKAGAVVGFAKVVHDITERKKSERRLREQALILDMATDAVFIRDSEDRITYWNQGAEKLYGWNKVETLGHVTHTILKTQFPQPLGDINAELLTTGHWSGELIHTRRDDSLVNVASSWTLQRDESSKSTSVLEVNHDITARKQTEERLNVVVRRLGLATDALQAGIWDWDVRTNDIVWDERMYQIYGIPNGTPVDYGVWAGAVVPEDLPATEAILQKVIASKSQGSADFRIKLPDTSLRYIQAAEGVILDSSGEVARIIGINIDTTGRKFNEDLERQVGERTAQLQAANKELEEFAYVASHDLKAPLRVIDNASKWLEEDLEDHLSEETRDHLILMRSRITRMEKLLDDLLEYARIGRATDARFAESINGEALIDDVVALLAFGDLSLTISPAFRDIQVTRLPLQHILLNLMSNAIKHHNKKTGHIEVTVEDAGDYFAFAVKDDGPGIPARFHDQIFKMFQTLRPRDKVEGSGMGLAMVRKNIEVFGGLLQLESAEDQGSTFRFTWPKQQQLVRKTA